jgi:flagellin-like hook-associated protein FlgL
MSITINSNAASTQTQINLKRASERLGSSLQRLSSGNRIITPSDDAGGLAVAMKLQSSLKRTTASLTSTQSGISFLQMQDSVLKIAGEIVDRMSELKTFHNDFSKSESDRETYNHEFKELQKELISLRSQKFNGVSLFGGNNNSDSFGINVSDDGSGERIQITRRGLFENFKSKYGADGVLNSGSQGAYRQLVGEFSKDGGPDAAMPGFASMDYAKNQVVYMDSGNVDAAGYYMALKDVPVGTKIEDTSELGSNWIKISDKNGQGFAESYPDAQLYNPYSSKKDARGANVAYLEGDVVKAPAHWNSSASNIFLRANSDVPQGKTMAEVFAEDLVGPGKMFEMVGESLATARPTTEFISENKNFKAPSLFSTDNFANLLKFHGASKGYTPGMVRVENLAEEETPDGDIPVSQVDQISGLRGDMQEKVYLIDESSVFGSPGDVFEVTVSGNGVPSQTFNFTATTDAPFQNLSNRLAAKLDEIRLPDNNNAFEVTTDATAGETRIKGLNVGDFSLAITPLDNGALDTAEITLDVEKPYKADEYTVTINGVSISANSKKEFNSEGTQATTAQALVDAINAHATLQGIVTAQLEEDDSLTLTGVIPGRMFTTEVSSTDVLSGEIAVGNDDKPTEAASLVVNTITSVSSATPSTSSSPEVVADKYDVYVPNGNWGIKTWDNNTSFNAGDLVFYNDAIYELQADLDVNAAIDKTADYEDLTNQALWTKTHFGNLKGKTLGADYARGDSFTYNGTSYLYISDLPSSDQKYDLDQDGVTEFDQLLSTGAIVKNPLHVEVRTGGGAGTGIPGTFYEANQELAFGGRLSNGQVLASQADLMSDSMALSADGISNSPDDLIYGGLEAGGDGIFGTADDYYAAGMGSASGYVDADADNNKNLLDESNGLGSFSTADFVDFIQTLANMRAVNGSTTSRLNYANQLLEESKANLEAAHGRIMDTDIALESSRLAQQSILMQASASMVTQANQLNQVVLQLLQ